MTHHVAQAQGELTMFTVDCRTTDELIAQRNAPAPTLMKVDVEGWEYHVLNGAHDLLQSSRLKAIAIEAACDPTGRLLDCRLESVLNDYGYRLSRIRRPEGEIRGVENYLAVRA